MCVDPATLAAVGMVANAGMSVAQAVNERKVSDYNAKMQEQQAREERQIAFAEEARKRSETDRALASQRAAFAANGLDTTVGAPLLAAYDSAKNAEMDALTIRAGGLSRAAAMQDNAQLTRARGRANSAIAIGSAGANLLTSTARWQNLYG